MPFKLFNNSNSRERERERESKLNERLRLILISIICGLLTIAIVNVIYAWTNPTANPPSGGGALYYYNGNVGIGTTTPGTHLDVADNVVNTGPFFRVLNRDAIFGGGIQVSAGNAYGKLDMLNSSGGVTGSLVNTTGGWQWNTQLNIMNGNVGIGTTTPGSLLHIHDSAGSGATIKSLLTLSGTITNVAGGFSIDWIHTGIAKFARIAGVTDAVGSTGELAFYTTTAIGSDGTEKVRINGAGNVGIGTTAPSRKLFVNGDAGGTTGWYNDSDIAFKKDIYDMKQYGLSTIMSLRPVNYTLKATGEKQIGLIAQEVKPIIPEIVSGEEGKMGIDYAKLNTVLIKAVQELKSENDALKQRVELLEQK